MRILIVEDEADTLHLLKLYFEARGHTVILARNGLEGVDRFRAMEPNMVLLDIRIPLMDGWQVLETIRGQSKIPVILLTALDSTEDAVKGLALGADDYLRKPFQLSELEARVQAIQRRIKLEAAGDCLQSGPVQIDDRAKRVSFNGTTVNLTPKEYQLLKLLATDPGRVFSNQEIIAQLWPASHDATPNEVKQYIHRLRSKVEEDPTRPRWIETVKGFGYKLVT